MNYTYYMEVLRRDFGKTYEKVKKLFLTEIVVSGKTKNT